jgi:hypothetical protein
MKSYQGMLHAKVSKIMSASPQQVLSIYHDYGNWHNLFPLTIRGAKLMRETGNEKTIEVDHKKAGKVVNILTILSNEEIKPEEFKKPL